MTPLFLTLLLSCFLLSALLGWKFRSLPVFLVVLVLSLAAVALLPPRANDVMVAERAREEEEAIGDTIDEQPAASVQDASPPSGSAINSPSREADELVSDSPSLTLATLQDQRPIEVTTHGYVGSDACLECHPDNHQTWDASYHSKMTQIADSNSVIGDFDNVRVISRGREYLLTHDDGVYMVEMPDENNPRNRIRAPIVMTTGSHHMQIYWFATGESRSVGMLPIVYHRESQEWIPRKSAFLVPPSPTTSFEIGRWNSSCSSCHATHQKPRRLPNGQWDTHVGEFGISCEACHGPGKDHLEYQQTAASGTPPDPTDAVPTEDPIVNPETLDKVASAQVCGQCHSVSDVLKMDPTFVENGHAYRPGKDLTETHGVWRRDSPEHRLVRAKLQYPDLDTLLDETYYPDGMVRVSGREFNGLIESSCYINGEMTCLSCHQMHQRVSDPRSLTEWTDDQLAPVALDNQACTQCHQADRYGSSHTHHPSESSGSNCYNCHMPHTAYGLLKAIRSHTISSPDIAADRASKRPNACNLCHLDQTLEWSARYLQQWYGVEPPALEKEEQEIAASLIWLLKGDAAKRAITAWHMGWSPAQQTSGNDWQLPFLTALLDDDYEAIRLIARRTLTTLPGLANFSMDVVTSSTSADRERKGVELLSQWFKQPSTKQIDRPELLIRDGGVVLVDRLRALIDQRDNRRIYLSE